LQTAIQYDYIIAGAGCAGYSLLYHLLQDPLLAKKKILVIDAHLKKGNDRTWCFWEDRPGPFESIVYKKWTSIEVRKDYMLRLLTTAPFEYKMVQGIDFYQFVEAHAKTFDTVHWQEGNIKSIETIGTNEAVITWVFRHKPRPNKFSLIYGNILKV
jgi:lycopene beta-cyclase